MRVEKTN